MGISGYLREDAFDFSNEVGILHNNIQVIVDLFLPYKHDNRIHQSHLPFPLGLVNLLGRGNVYHVLCVEWYMVRDHR